ncbi:MAG: MMPL family transporter [Spirochaetia bacterium]|nr:MMPL family transporter [Spirochaetia bacterium]
MKKIIESWITFVINHPRLTLISIVFLTAFFSVGIFKIEMDSSVEYLMPKDEPVYKLTERVKVAMVNEKTFLIASIEADKEHKLLSKETFQTMNLLVEEIQEYKDFNLYLEDKRLNSIIKTGNAFYKEEKSAKPQKEAQNKEEIALKSLEEDLDKMILESETEGVEEASKLLKKEKPVSADIWDMSKPLPEDRFAEPIRGKRTYDFSKYQITSIKKIKTNLDTIAQRQLDTILIYLKLDSLNEDEELTKKQFAAILNTWEELYLYKSMNIVRMFLNPISGEDISGKNKELTPIDFIEKDETGKRALPENEHDFIEYEKKIKLNPLNSINLYSLNNEGEIQAFAMAISLRTLEHYNEFYNIFHYVIEKYNRTPLKLHIMGSMVIEKYMQQFMERDLSVFLPIVFALVILTFFLNFYSLRGVMLPTLTVALGMIWTMGLLGHLGVKMSLLVNILPPLLIAIGSSYSIHMFNQYMLELKNFTKENMKKALIECMSHISGTIFLAGFTTCMSFLTLSGSQVTSMRHFGQFAAAGAFFGMLITFLLIPGALILLRPIKPEKIKKKKGSNKFIHLILDKLSHLSTAHAKRITILSVILLIMGIFGLTKVTPETAPMYNFKDDSIIRKADDRIGELFQGTFAINLVFDTGKKDGAKEPEFLKFIEKMQSWADDPAQKNEYHILSTSTFGDFIKRMNMAINDDNIDFYKIPESGQTIRDYLEIFSGKDDNSDGRADAFEQFVDIDYQRVNLIIKTGSTKEKLFSTAVNKKLEKRIIEYLSEENHPPNNAPYFMAGSTMSFPVLADYIFESQTSSVILSLIIIFILIYILFKRIKASFVSLLPICFGISQVYGLMGFLDIPLDIPKVILSSIAIGIGIDDTIHFMRTMSHFLKKGMSMKEAIYQTHREAGLAITYTSVALILGFSILMLSSFKPVFFLGLLVSGVMFSTTLGALLFLPAYIYLFKIEVPDFENENIGS